MRTYVQCCRVSYSHLRTQVALRHLTHHITLRVADTLEPLNILCTLLNAFTKLTVKAELAPSLPAFMPAACLSTQVPVMAVSSDLGQAGTVLEAGTLACSGPYVIEQVELDADEGGGTFRRLVFMQSQGVIQTEVKLVAAVSSDAIVGAARKQAKRKGKGKRKGSKKTASTSNTTSSTTADDEEEGDAPGAAVLCEDFSYLCFDYHKVMIAGAALGGLLHSSGTSSSTSNSRTVAAVPTALLIGLGGGALPMALRRFYPKLAVTVCELDPQMLDLATRWFGFQEGPALRVVVGDGLVYAQQCLEQLQTSTAAATATAATSAATANGAGRDAPSAAVSENDSTSAAAAAAVAVNGSSSAATSSEDSTDGTAAAAAAATPGAPFAAIFIDVDSKDASVGMSCPPAAFAEESYLRILHNLLQEHGVLAINVAARSAQLHAGVLAAVTAVFCSNSDSSSDTSSSTGGEVHQLRASDEDVNTVVLALKGRRHASALPLTAVVRDVVAAAGAAKEASDMVDMADMMERISVSEPAAAAGAGKPKGKQRGKK
jgi:spermidine synthase